MEIHMFIDDPFSRFNYSSGAYGWDLGDEVLLSKSGEPREVTTQEPASGSPRNEPSLLDPLGEGLVKLCQMGTGLALGFVRETGGYIIREHPLTQFLGSADKAREHNRTPLGQAIVDFREFGEKFIYPYGVAERAMNDIKEPLLSAENSLNKGQYSKAGFKLGVALSESALLGIKAFTTFSGLPALGRGLALGLAYTAK
jgi:hypothetical protein